MLFGPTYRHYGQACFPEVAHIKTSTFTHRAGNGELLFPLGKGDLKETANWRCKEGSIRRRWWRKSLMPVQVRYKGTLNISAWAASPVSANKVYREQDSHPPSPCLHWDDDEWNTAPTEVCEEQKAVGFPRNLQPGIEGNNFKQNNAWRVNSVAAWSSGP